VRTFSEEGVVHMKRCLAIIAAALLLWPGLAVGTDGTQWMGFDQLGRGGYIMGAADTWIDIMENAKIRMKSDQPVSNYEQGIVQIVRCTGGKMRYSQIEAIVHKYMKEHPENLHLPMSQNAVLAMILACKKL